MKTIPRLILLACFAPLAGGCALGLGKSLHQYSLNETLSETPPNAKARPIESSALQNVFILTSNTDFPDEAYLELLDQCRKGRIVNIVAKHTTDLGLLAYQNKMVLSGTCIE